MTSNILKTNKERLTALLEQNHTAWEDGFCRSLLEQSQKESFRNFSPKQEYCLREMEDKYGLDRMQSNEPTDVRVIRPAPMHNKPDASARQKLKDTKGYFDYKDDDIPF